MSTTVEVADRTVVAGNTKAWLDLRILGGKAFAGGTFSIQICRPGTPPSLPAEHADEHATSDIQFVDIRFGGRTVWRHGEPSQPQLIAPPVYGPTNSQVVYNFGHIPFGQPSEEDPDRPPPAGIRVGEGLLAELVISVSEDAAGVYPVRCNFQGFSVVNGVKVSEDGRFEPDKLETTWVDGKISIYQWENLLTPAELEWFEYIKGGSL